MGGVIKQSLKTRMSFLEIYFICHEFQVKEQLRDAKGAHALTWPVTLHTL